MHKFVRNLLTEWRKLELPFAEETILIAVSGGADSAALALALHDLKKAKKLNLNFVIAHFNHNLRSAESDADAEFVKDFAKELDFEFVSEIQNPKSKIQDQKDNLEQSARYERYDFLRRAAEKENACAVLTAHTLNDQAETFLFNLLRGSGVEGLGAMRKVRELNDTKHIQSAIRSPQSATFLVRPLLGWAKRGDTENFARENEIDFRHDRMNDDEKFSRVKMRKKLLPLLAEFNPKAVETLARTAFLLQSSEFLPTEDEDFKGETLSVSKLQKLPPPKLYVNLRVWLRARRGDLRGITTAHIQAIERLIMSRKSGRKIELPGEASVVKKDGRIFFEKSKVEKSRSAN